MLTRDTLDAHAAQDTPPAFSSAPISDEAIALLGYQRTKQVSPKSRKAWEAGDPTLLKKEARDRRDTIFAGALAEMWPEYLPLRTYLQDHGFKPKSIIDIGCGQALPDLFLHHDFKPHFTLVDIEQTGDQYHFWAETGAGYASLDQAVALLHGNGVAKSKVNAINPTKTPDAMTGLKADMLTSFYSCGFHYPVDDYADLMVATLDAGGTICLDLRKRYLRRNPDTLARVLAAGERTDLYEDARSFRVALRGV